MSSKIRPISQLSVLENIFMYNGNPHHEIVFVFSAKFKDQNLYNSDIIDGYELGNYFQATWQSVEKFMSRELILYPTGIHNFLSAAD